MIRSADPCDDAPTRGLTQQDAFFVAYQEESVVAMQLGVEIELAGELQLEDLERTLARLVELWPHLGQRVYRRLLGLVWRGPVRLDDMLVVADEAQALERWRNTLIDPFQEPAFQLLWIRLPPGANAHAAGRPCGILAFRAHHSAVDGRSFYNACAYALRVLSAGDEAAVEGSRATAEGAGFRQLLREGRLGSMWRYMRWMARESKLGRSTHLVVRATEPGDVDVCTRWLDSAARQKLVKQAKDAGVDLPWYCCAAWVRAIGGWNAERGESNPVVSLEVPVSARAVSGQAPLRELGNDVSPLLLFAEADQPIAAIGQSLRKQFMQGVRERAHLALPTFTAAGRYLPWWLFRRLAADTTYSGFATSHYTWLRAPGDIHADVARLSGGRLELLGQSFYTPVCLHMGAALMVLAKKSELQLSLTHRLNALPPPDAARLLDRLEVELLPT